MKIIEFEKFKYENGTFLALWSGLKYGDVGQEILVDFAADISVQVTGTFNRASLSIEGSNDGDNWFLLNTYPEKPACFYAAGLRKLNENPIYIRPVMGMDAGIETKLDVVISCKCSSP